MLRGQYAVCCMLLMILSSVMLLALVLSRVLVVWIALFGALAAPARCLGRPRLHPLGYLNQGLWYPAQLLTHWVSAQQKALSLCQSQSQGTCRQP